MISREDIWWKADPGSIENNVAPLLIAQYDLLAFESDDFKESIIVKYLIHGENWTDELKDKAIEGMHKKLQEVLLKFEK